MRFLLRSGCLIVIMCFAAKPGMAVETDVKKHKKTAPTQVIGDSGRPAPTGVIGDTGRPTPTGVIGDFGKPKPKPDNMIRDPRRPVK